MKEGAGGAGALLGEKKHIWKSLLFQRESCFTKLKCIHKTPERENVCVCVCVCVCVKGKTHKARESEGGLSVFNILDLCWKISKTDAGISFECIWVLTGLAGGQAGTCCWPSTESLSWSLRCFIALRQPARLSICSVFVLFFSFFFFF